jgi:hypothetical protein
MHGLLVLVVILIHRRYIAFYLLFIPDLLDGGMIAMSWSISVWVNRLRTLLHFGFVIITVCMALVLLISLCSRDAWSVQFPTDLTKLETPRTYINCDLLYRQFLPIQDISRVLAQESPAEPDNVYAQYSVSFSQAYGTVPYNDRCLLIEPKVGVILPRLKSR